MTKYKSLGQIAWEAIKENRRPPWDKQSQLMKALYEREAAAVAREVRRQDKERQEEERCKVSLNLPDE